MLLSLEANDRDVAKVDPNCALKFLNSELLGKIVGCLSEYNDAFNRPSKIESRLEPRAWKAGLEIKRETLGSKLRPRGPIFGQKE